MADSEPIDSYFTRQIVGETVVVALGLSHSVHQQPEQGVWFDAVADRAMLMGAAAVGLWTGEPSQAVPGQPVSPARFKRFRRLLVAFALGLWSVALWLAFHALYGR